MRKRYDYYEIWSSSQNTVRSLFRKNNRGIEICDGKIILVDGDAQMKSLRDGLYALEEAKGRLGNCLNMMEQVGKVKEKAKIGDFSGGTAEDVDKRLNYVSRLAMAIEKVIKYLEIPDILEKNANLAIHELVGLVTVTGGRSSPSPPITITVCEEYTI
jgi:hypothetical protein